MIENYRDHAANERTYLAWIRTGITVMVLGLIVEKFDLFLASLRGLLGVKLMETPRGHAPEYVSLALVLLGMLVISAGAIRYFRVRKLIRASETIQSSCFILALLLTLSLVAFGVYLLLYLSRAF
jgi:putative membrane protein